MEFGIEKRYNTRNESGKRQLPDGIELPNQDKKTKPTNIWVCWRLSPSNK